MKQVKAVDLHEKWMKEADYARTFESLRDEYELAAAMIAARSRAGLTQAELARRMKTTPGRDRST